jgi:RsiW-degrading membrane proteinase PrsW (M82 family)
MRALLLAVIPGIVLFIVVWKNDGYEKEPPKLLLKLFLFGALTTISAMIIEILFDSVILAFMDHGRILYQLIDNFLIVALTEEAGKYLVLKKTTWRHPAFNYTFDAIVYSVAVSLGFATLENVFYLIEESVSVAILRGLFSVPGHVIYAIYMGYFYGLAKYAVARHDEKGKNKYLRRAFLFPVLMHGFYDFCLDTESTAFILIFFVFEIVITIMTIAKFIKLSKANAPIPGSDEALGAEADQPD